MPEGCRECEYTGYQWESYDTCPKCDKGRAEQHKQDVAELKWCNWRVRMLRARIKEYNELQKAVRK